MAWFKVDDQSTFHAKVLRAGNAAYGAWVRMGCYCNAHLTDGHVADSVAHMIATKKEIDLMCVAGLARKVEGGYEIHDYLQYQPSRESVMQKRATTRDRVKRFRNAPRNNDGNAVTDALVTMPPSSKGSGRDRDLQDSETDRVSGSRFITAWTGAGLPGLPAIAPLVEALRELPEEQIPEGVEAKFCAAVVAYCAAYLEHKNVKIPADPLRLADPKHFGNIIEVMLGRFDLAKLASKGNGARLEQPRRKYEDAEDYIERQRRAAGDE